MSNVQLQSKFKKQPIKTGMTNSSIREGFTTYLHLMQSFIKLLNNVTTLFCTQTKHVLSIKVLL